LRTGGLYEAVIGDHRRMRDSPVRFAAENDEDALAPRRITAMAIKRRPFEIT